MILKSFIAKIFPDLSKCADGFVLMPGQEVAGDHHLGAYTGLSTNHCADICNLIQVYQTLQWCCVTELKVPSSGTSSNFDGTELVPFTKYWILL